MTFTPKHTRDWEAQIKAAAKAAVEALHQAFGETWPLVDADYSVDVVIARARLVGDLDNYVKAVTDAINGVAYPDDKLVCRLSASMVLDRQNPGVLVRVERYPYGSKSGADH